MKTLSLFILFTFLTFSSVFSQGTAYSFSESYNVTEPTSLKISSKDSNISILSHESSTIEIHFTVRKNGKTLSIDKSTLIDLTKEQSNLNISYTEGEMKIVVTKVAQYGYIKSEDAFIIDFVVYVPKQTSCEIESSDGYISLRGLNSNQKCITSDGDIKLIDLKGDVIAKTSDGDIFIKNVRGKVDSHTNDGQVIKLKR
jgi:hypothetical protein